MEAKLSSVRSNRMSESLLILSTRPIDDPTTQELRMKGIEVQVVPFIDTVPIEDMATTLRIKEIMSSRSTVVFTSMNGVQAVADKLVWGTPAWRIYTMGTTTRKLVEHYFEPESIAGTGNNASELAHKIIRDGVDKEVVFFCGDIRRDELPNALREAGINVKEITVYNTLETPKKLNEEFDGILFFSPSAVRSFFRVNRVPPQTILFSIGDTTAAEIRKHAQNTVVVNDVPGKENLIRALTEYYQR
jgi:uroporphyrinogen-III synthase